MSEKVHRALVSVYDKTGVVDFARALSELGVEIVSSGGTADTLAGEGVPVTTVEDVTGAPEMLGGRVKTLHPRIHGGILADRGDEQHRADLEAQQIEGIDLVVVNLYPFVENPGIETIDIGGPTMVRAAAKNHEWVGVVTSPDQYDGVLGELRANDGVLSGDTRRSLALEAFALTASYDAAIVGWLQDGDTLPEHLVVPLRRASTLRYGENPHQQAARYVERNVAAGWPEQAIQHGGKELSFINLFDAEASYQLAHRFDAPCVVVVKHANPSGVALHDDIAEAYSRAFDCDSLSAFGGVVAANRPVNQEMASRIAEVFTEVVVAPGYEQGALDTLTEKQNLRVLEAPPPGSRGLDLRRLDGGFLVQETDGILVDRDTWKVVTETAPTDELWDELAFAYVVCAATTSNTIVLTRGRQAFGIGAGQQSRVHAAEIAAEKADGRARGGVCASDAFFPFRDGVDAAAAAGVAAVIQPGGSIRDEEVIAAADEHGIAMVFTGQRHFRH